MTEWWLPWLATNLLSTGIFLLCILRPRAGRIAWVVIFALAAVVNTSTALWAPMSYVEGLGPPALEIYEMFIYGWFAANAQPFVLAIALGQLLIAIGLLIRGVPRKAALVAAFLFLLAIAPLGLGSAFPASIVMAGSMGRLFWLELVGEPVRSTDQGRHDDRPLAKRP